MIEMKRLLTGGIATGLLAATVLGLTLPAQARDDGAVAAGVIGGLALGAIAGSAGAPAYGYGYAQPRAYGGCYLQREPIYDDYGNFIRYRRVRVCE